MSRLNDRELTELTAKLVETAGLYENPEQLQEQFRAILSKALEPVSTPQPPDAWEEDSLIFDHLHLVRTEIVRVLRKHGYTRSMESYHRRSVELRNRYKAVFYSGPRMLALLRQADSANLQWVADRDALVTELTQSVPDFERVFRIHGVL